MTVDDFTEDRLVRLSQERSEEAWLKNFRVNALRSYKATPEEKNEMLKKYSDGIDYSGIVEGASQMQRSDKIIAPEIKNCVFIDGHSYYKNIDSVGIDIDDDFDFSSYEKMDYNNQDRSSYLIDAFFNSLTIIRVKKEYNGGPVRQIFSLDGKNTVLNKTVIITDEDSSIDLIQEIYSKGETRNHFGNNISIYSEKGSKVRFTSIQNLKGSEHIILNKKIYTHGSAELTALNLGGERIRSRASINLLSEGSSFAAGDGFFGSGSQYMDSFILLRHMAKSTNSTFHSRSVLDGRSKAVSKGIIKLEKPAAKSNAFLVEHSLLLNKEARTNAVPSLEIETDDVKATHSASSHPLDKDQVFYLMSRGLDREEAENEIAMGFIWPVISHIKSKNLITHIYNLLRDKRKGTCTAEGFADITDYLGNQGDSLESGIFVGHYKYR